MKTDPSIAPPTSMAVARRQVWLDKLVALSDDKFTIPGTNIKFGLDALLGFLLPELGDTITGLLGGIVLVIAWKEGAPPMLLARMAGNIALDVLIGMVPILGDVVDVAFRSNRRNHTLLRAFQRQRFGVPLTGKDPQDFPLVAHEESPSWLVGGVLITLVVVLLALPLGALFLLGHLVLG